MSSRSVILIGGPDSGKTNYVGRLWPSFRKRKGVLRAEGLPDNIEYVDGAVEHLMQGSFAPRSDRNLEEGRRDFSIQVRNSNGQSPLTELVVPDISGELWTRAVRSSELPEDWLQALKAAEGAVLFVRAHSKLNVQPMDWVTARRLLKLYEEDPARDQASHHEWSETEVVALSDTASAPVQGEETGGEPEANGIPPPPTPELPTQVVLCELLRYLNLLLADRVDGGRPRVAVVVAAWDLLDPELRAASPMAYLKRQFPLLAGRISCPGRLDVRLFGLSIVGGDLENDPAFKESFLKGDIVDQGWVVVEENGLGRQDDDITLPIAWAVGE
jgi:hypothetical protein